MVQYTQEPSGIDDKRKVIVNGKKYHAVTTTKCTVCTVEDRYMCVKQHHTGNNSSLECPYCEHIITVHDMMYKQKESDTDESDE